MPQQHVPLSAAMSGFFIPEAVMGAEAAAARRTRRGETENGGRDRGDGGAEGLGEWREEGNKRRRFGGKEEAAWREAQVGPEPQVG